MLWTAIFILFFFLRFTVNLVWRMLYVPYLDLIEVLFASLAWGYAVYCGYRCYLGEIFRIPN